MAPTPYSGQASVVVAPRLRSTGSVTVAQGFSNPQQLGSSKIRDQTHVSCIGRQILHCWSTREVQNILLNVEFIADLV